MKASFFGGTWLFVLLMVVTLGMGCTASDTIEPSSDYISISVLGATSETCTVYGEEDRKLGSGKATAFMYRVGLENAVRVVCGDLSAIAYVGENPVTVNDRTTTVANMLTDLPMYQGTYAIAHHMLSLIDQDDPVPASGAMNFDHEISFQQANGAEATTGHLVMQSLAQFLKNHWKTEKPTGQFPIDEAELKKSLVGTLLYLGMPVFIENIGKSGVIPACTRDAVATTFSDSITVASDADLEYLNLDASGCLLYNRFDAITDLNGSFGFIPPAHNVPSSFRQLATESGIVQAMLDSLMSGTVYDAGAIFDYIFGQNKLGRGVYVPDLDGNKIDHDMVRDDLLRFYAQFIRLPEDFTDYASFLYHRDYNPSGGAKIDVLALRSEIAALTDDERKACREDLDSDAPCPIDPIYWSLNDPSQTPTSLDDFSEDPNGDYFIRLFTDAKKAYPMRRSDEKPLRDFFYQPISFDFDKEAEPKTYNNIFYPSPLHDSALNPMLDLDAGVTRPFSNTAYRNQYPNFRLLDNTHLYHVPEVTLRIAYMLNMLGSLEYVTTMEAFALFQLALRVISALPFTRGGETQYAIFEDHGKTVLEWDRIVAEFFRATGTQTGHLLGGGQIRLRPGPDQTYLFHSFHVAQCWKLDKTRLQNCTIDSTLSLDRGSVEEIEEDGATFDRYLLIGDLVIDHPQVFNQSTYLPTHLDAFNDSVMFLGGDAYLVLNFLVPNFSSEMDKDRNINAVFRFLAIEK